MEINELSHPDSIWTFKNSERNHRASIWLPYLQSIEKIKRQKHKYHASYKGGEIVLDLKKIDCIMIYGAVGTIPVEFLDDLGVNRIPLIIHRRNLSNPYCFIPAMKDDRNDIITQHIAARNNDIKRVYIAKCLIRARYQSLSAMLAYDTKLAKRLAKLRSIGKVRNLEAQLIKTYWRKYYAHCGVLGTTRRDATKPINQALNACSVFIMGILLRWVLMHRLLPTHGFLHEPTSYPALVYDLMEPARVWIEQAVIKAIHTAQSDEVILPISLNNLKAILQEVVYVPATHQLVRKKNILHGIVLALRSYIIGETKRFVIPMEGPRKGGRPPKVAYKLPGEIKTTSPREYINHLS